MTQPRNGLAASPHGEPVHPEVSKGPSGPAKPDPRRPLGSAGFMHPEYRFGIVEN